MKAVELRSKSVSELRTVLSDLRKESFNLRIQKTSGQLENLSKIKIVRRNIALVKTIINEQNQKDGKETV